MNGDIFTLGGQVQHLNLKKVKKPKKINCTSLFRPKDLTIYIYI